jgi:hypothetical protein
MARGQSGRQLVTLAVAATVSTIALGSIYLPFMADRDKLRGLSEEGEDAMPEGARREIRDLMRKEREDVERREGACQEEREERQQQKATAGSMWGSFRRNQ